MYATDKRVVRKEERIKTHLIFILFVCISFSSLFNVTIGVSNLEKENIFSTFHCMRKKTHTNFCLAKSSEGFGFRFDFGKVVQLCGGTFDYDKIV